MMASTRNLLRVFVENFLYENDNEGVQEEFLDLSHNSAVKILKKMWEIRGKA